MITRFRWVRVLDDEMTRIIGAMTHRSSTKLCCFIPSCLGMVKDHAVPLVCQPSTALRLATKDPLSLTQPPFTGLSRLAKHCSPPPTHTARQLISSRLSFAVLISPGSYYLQQTPRQFQISHIDKLLLINENTKSLKTSDGRCFNVSKLQSPRVNIHHTTFSSTQPSDISA